MIPFFANSYFLELSNIVTPKQIEFVKYNNDYRKKEYDIFTYLKDNEVQYISFNATNSLSAHKFVNEFKKNSSNVNTTIEL